MSLSRTGWLRVIFGVGVVLAALFFIRLHNASGATSAEDSVSAGHQLAAAWCKNCHAIEAASSGAGVGSRDFNAIANRPATTALSIKVFLQTSHRRMPNIIIAPEQADALADYIISLKRN